MQPLASLAVLLAAATVTTRAGFRASMSAMRGSTDPDSDRARWTSEVIPSTRSRRRYRSPILEIRPSRSLPPLDRCNGVNPRDAANWRADGGGKRGRCNCSSPIWRAMQRQRGLLLGGLDPNEALFGWLAGQPLRTGKWVGFLLCCHAPGMACSHALADRFSLVRIGLAPLHIGLHVGWRHQPDIVAKLQSQPNSERA
jgi:hypothetical protein